MGFILSARKSGYNDSTRRALRPASQSNSRTKARETAHCRLKMAKGYQAEAVKLDSGKSSDIGEPPARS
jgi:hypothetical protein